MAHCTRRSSSGSARSPGRRERRVRSAGLLLVASVLLALVPQNAALAHGHTEPRAKDGFGYHTSNWICLWSQVWQYHYSHELHTQTWIASAGRPCYYPVNRAPGEIQHRTEYYKSQPWLYQPYQLCNKMFGWARNTVTTWHLDTVNNWDIWPSGSCNWGPGVYVDITMDFWQKFLNAGTHFPSTAGLAWRPATHHCHCP
jgi:hypothetical protein